MNRANPSRFTHIRMLIIRALPAIILVGLTGLTWLVWRQQVHHQQALLANHTRDLCFQASRRLQIFIESRLSVVELLATRWATHETRDYTERRFREIAHLLLEAFEGYHAVALVHVGEDGVSPGGESSGDNALSSRPRHRGSVWITPAENTSLDQFLSMKSAEDLLSQALEQRRAVLSAPIELEAGQISLFSAVPLFYRSEFMGFFVVEVRAKTLIDDCFQEHIRAEFNFAIHDLDKLLFRWAPEDFAEETNGDLHHERTFSVRNREWKLVVVPRHESIAESGYLANSSIAALGLLLSLALSLLVFVLIQRMGELGNARDRALAEIEEREKAEVALRLSQARLRSVFDSSSDGLLVLDTAGDIVVANPAAATLHGIKPSELQRHSFGSLLADDCRHLLSDILSSSDGSRGIRLETRHRRADGSVIEVELRAKQFLHDGERAVLVILSDETEHRQTMKRLALLSRKVLEAQEEERTRIARELHDEIGQLLTALRLEIDWMNKQHPSSPEAVSEAIERATSLVVRAVEELRLMCRGLRPPLLDDLGLEPAVQLLVEEFQTRTPFEVDLQIDLDDAEVNIPIEVALCTYRVIQECLTNISRHSNASHVDITLTVCSDELVLSVYDDGCGFDYERLSEEKGLGLQGMSERARLAGGGLVVRSKPSEGTRIRLRVPLHVLSTKSQLGQPLGGRDEDSKHSASKQARSRDDSRVDRG